MDNIAIIEYRQDINQALKRFRLKDTLFLSVSSEASYYLLKRNIPFLTDEDILSVDEFKKLGYQNFELTEGWIRQLEEILHAVSPMFEKNDFYPFKWHFYRLKILIDTIRIKYVLLKRLIEKERPRFIGFPAGVDLESIPDHNLFFYRNDSIYGLLAESITSEEKLGATSWRKVKPPHLMGLRLRKFIKQQLRENKLLGKISSEKAVNRAGKENILLSTTHYDIGPLINVLQPRYHFYLYEDPLTIRPLGSYAKVQPTLLSIPDFPEIDANIFGNASEITGIHIIDRIFQSRIYHYAKRILPAIWEGLGYLTAVDNQEKFKAFFHYGGMSDSFSGLPVQHVQHHKNPLIVFQHGAYAIGPSEVGIYSECGHDGYYFSWGDGIGQMYEGRKKGTCDIIPTGSRLIENIRESRKMPKNIRNVCYVTNGYRGNISYYPNGQPSCDSMLFLAEMNFLKTLIPFQKKYNITYKVDPRCIKYSEGVGYNPMINWIKENMPFVNIAWKPLESIIHDYDCFIIDWPSTTLIQACATGAEIVAYVGNKYYTPTRDALELLRKRAVLGETEKDFMDKIRKVLEAGRVVSDVKDTSFLEKYGIFKDDGKSLERIIGNIEDIFTPKKPQAVLRTKG